MVTFDAVGPNVLKAALDVFVVISGTLSAVVAAVIMGRFVLTQITFGSASEYGETLKDLLKYLLICSMFPFLVNTTFDVVNGIAKKISYIPSEKIHLAFMEVSSRLLSDSLWAMVGGPLIDLTILVGAHTVYTLMVAVLIAVGGIIFFMSLILGLSIPVRTYFMILITFSLWPILWNTLGILGEKLFTGDEPFRAAIYWLALHIIQAFSPIFMFKLLSSGMATEAVGSVGRAASAVVTRSPPKTAFKPYAKVMKPIRTNLPKGR